MSMYEGDTAAAERARTERINRNYTWIRAWQRYISGTLYANLSPADFPPAIRTQVKSWLDSTVVTLRIQGNVGSGKTTLAHVVGSMYATEGYHAERVTYPELLRLVWSRAEEDLLQMRRLRKCHLLIIDDFGAKAAHENQIGEVCDLLESRAVRRDGVTRTIVTTNDDLTSEEAAALGTAFEPLFSRLTGTTITFVAPGKRKEFWQ